jgi:glycosyltransferase involved in cell wall biosynthesis
MISSQKPLVSVLLPVYNGEKYLKEAIKSILRQTYKNFELIIINDGSKDKSIKIVKSFKDKRIKLYSQRNKGLAVTLNRAIKLSKGKYLARQDQDDVSFPQRLSKQVDFLEKNPKTAVVGCWAKIIKERKKTSKTATHPAKDIALKFETLFNSRFIHGSVLMIKKAILDIGLYTEDKTRQPPEDFELWSRVIRKYQIANLPEFLLYYREVPGSMSRDKKKPFTKKIIKITKENLSWAARRPVTDKYIIALAVLIHNKNAKIIKNLKFEGYKKLLDEIVLNFKTDMEVKKELKKRAQILLKNIKPYYIKNKFGKLQYFALALDKIGVNI